MNDIQEIAQIDPESWVTQGLRALDSGIQYFGKWAILGLIALIIVGHYWSKRRPKDG